MGLEQNPRKSHVNNLASDYSKQNGDCDQVNTSTEKHASKKNKLATIIVTEYKYISDLFDLLDIDYLNQGRKAVDEDDNKKFKVRNIPEQKVFKKTPSRKRIKNKSYPHSIEEIEKELEELKGTPMSYQKQVRKKGLQVRLTKKKRKENLKQQKATLLKGIKLSGSGKLIKPVLNSDGNVVSNKFDFADSEVKKEIKRKHTTSVSEFKDEKETKKKFKSLSNDSQVNDEKPQIRNGNEDLGSSSNIVTNDNNINAHQGPVFNRDNKMVFSRIFVSDNDRKSIKKSVDKNLTTILKKIKEGSKPSELGKEDNEKTVVIKEKEKWSIALKRASGEKVKDDPELLKKSIDKDKNLKMRSKKKWQSRLDHVQKGIELKQKKRTDNIQARKLEIKKRKMKRAMKKGRFVKV